MNDEELVELKEWIMEEDMPYLKAPAGAWIQKDKKFLFISYMNETHIKNCIKLIERDIKGLKNRGGLIKQELIPIAEEKIRELKEEYKSRI